MRGAHAEFQKMVPIRPNRVYELARVWLAAHKASLKLPYLTFGRFVLKSCVCVLAVTIWHRA
jgi:hypothetical protein